MDDDNNFFAVPPQDGIPLPDGDAPPADASTDFFGAAVSADESAPGAFIGDVNETDGFMDGGFAAPPPVGYAPPPVDDSDPFGSVPPADSDFAAPPLDGNAIILGGPPPVEDGEEEPVEPVEPLGPSPMQKWNEEWQETLKQRKDDENAKKAELLEAARVALENFQKEREMKRENKMSKNREDEQAKLEAIEADLENDNSWQRVCKMVELSHDSTEKAEDVKRMRDALIYLKNDTARAEVLGS